MKITLVKMGMDFKAGKKNGSDVLNHRVRAEFTDRNGISVVGDFTGWTRREIYTKRSGKTGYRIANKNQMAFDGDYESGDYRKSYRPELLGIDMKSFNFTRADILKFLSIVTGNNYTEIEFID